MLHHQFVQQSITEEIIKLYADSNIRISKLERQNEIFSAALKRLRDCEYVITPADRMDAVRKIAKTALDDAFL
jgi:hypothetical protein